MGKTQSPAPLCLVIGASVGALVGLAFIRTSAWLILVGAVLGFMVVGLIGLRVGVSGTPIADAMDDTALEAGCCLMEAVGLGCFGCGTITATLLGGLLLVGLHHIGGRALS